MKTLVGIVTYGGFDFTKLAIESFDRTVKSPFDLFVVVGRPSDIITKQWLDASAVPNIVHEVNMGFPASLNDIYDYAFVHNDYDYLITAGNDIICYPYAIDSMISLADESDWEWISSSQYDVKTLLSQFPETAVSFHGSEDKLLIEDFRSRPWDKFTGYSQERVIEPNVIKDVHNLCLYKRSAFEAIGYVDPNFYPAYYEDNDYARRGVNAKLKTCNLTNSVYFHFWSRTIKQFPTNAPMEKTSNHQYFNNNRKFYMIKWGGDFGQETYDVPFNGQPYLLGGKIPLEPSIKISRRDNEREIVDYWRPQG